MTTPFPPSNTNAIAASDGNTAYACSQADAATTIEVRATHDGSAHWARVTNVPSVLHGTCAILIDHNNAANLIIKVLLLPPPYPTSSATRMPSGVRSAPGANEIADYLSLTSGQSWRLIPHQTFVSEFASAAKNLYALIGGNPDLVVSHDGMQSWQRLSPPATQSPPSGKPDARMDGAPQTHLRPLSSADFEELWVQPFDKEIMYTGNDFEQGWQSVAYSADGGQSWTTLTLPETFYMLAFQMPITSHAWTICALGTAFWCSQDSGHTWTKRSTPTEIDPSRQIASAFLIGVAAHGDLLATIEDTAQNTALYRLTPNATTWQAISPVPNGYVQFAGPAARNTLWALNTSPTTAFPTQGDYRVTYP